MSKNNTHNSNNTPTIYSHVRSGTHFLEAFLAKNYFPNKRLKKHKVMWGHWTNRKRKWTGNKYGKLFGNHYFYKENINKINNEPSIYIARDGRAVAYSVWNTPNFINKNWRPISFSDFLQTPLDWDGTPSRKADKGRTIVEHWLKHVDGYKKANSKNLLVIRYEDLKNNPNRVQKALSKKFGLNPVGSVKRIKKPVGLKPNKAKIDSWKNVFTDEDLKYFHSIVDKDHWALYDD